MSLTRVRFLTGRPAGRLRFATKGKAGQLHFLTGAAAGTLRFVTGGQGGHLVFLTGAPAGHLRFVVGAEQATLRFYVGGRTGTLRFAVGEFTPFTGQLSARLRAGCGSVRLRALNMPLTTAWTLSVQGPGDTELAVTREPAGSWLFSTPTAGIYQVSATAAVPGEPVQNLQLAVLNNCAALRGLATLSKRTCGCHAEAFRQYAYYNAQSIVLFETGAYAACLSYLQLLADLADEAACTCLIPSSSSR